MATNEKAADDNGGLPPAAGVTELSYSDAGKELDAIIGEFEAGVIDVDRLVERLQRATSIVDELDRRLRRTRMQVEELVPRLEAIGRGEPGTGGTGETGETGEAGETDGGEEYDEGELIAEMTMDGRSDADAEGPAGLF
jgi:exonuclease VII small subunit